MSTIKNALRRATSEAISQPTEVPERKIGWITRTLVAINTDDEAAIKVCADEIRIAHSQYRADFGEKAWLFELRKLHQKTLPA